MASVTAKSILSSNLLTWTYITGMDDSLSVIEIIEKDESEELIEAAEPVEIFECNSLPDNMEATEVVKEIVIEYKSPRVQKKEKT